MTLTGLYVPLITPFDDSGAVARGALESLAHQLLDAGASGLVALGTTAEPGSLTVAEQDVVVEVAARACRERGAQLLVGAHSPEALRGLADRPEVVAALSLVPSFVRPGAAGVLAHFAHLAATSPVPIVVYDVPRRTGQYLPVETLRRLAELPGVVGLKYSPDGVNADTVALFADPPAGLAILGGEDTFLSALLALGAHGGIVASAHLATAEYVRLIALWQAGDVAAARALGGRLSVLSTALFAEPNPTVIKAVLHAEGRIPSAAVRLPLLAAGPDTTATAYAHLDALTSPSTGRPAAPPEPAVAG
ncbi:dihydrodipicolinate synthase family protein [Plantactinospora sp. S1510]|uniref:Dihydrodipicolinate synthase family protein n=1 Tax=Plantactinospora alkalitolerans TaxID=2789879 RepID=A0ABS0GYN5_9ACTN|nr:dihydrodipicolinate synthase family protein [Plantactinospora alkalitolerans]MBF9131314.1 dihydrodipicolinate synthase family protein [Plantactinospora alkalitolerans]